MKPVCLNCRGSNIEYDTSQGNSFCADCGAVLEENTVVSEVTFAELSSGASVLQGQFVSAERGRVTAPSIFGRRMGPLGGAGGGTLGAVSADGRNADVVSESREVTLANGKRRLAAVAVALGLGDHHVEMAHRWFTLALQHQFTRGRRSNNIIASCLYIVCRLERTPHMLLDFSDILQTSVYSLGGTFLRLTQLLNLELPLVDPSFYIGRFASKLEFAEKTQQVVNSALRISARMKRDWIVTGRRPAGVCAAALLVAARMNGFRRTERQIVRTVHICEATLRRRLAEFASTPSSKLSTEEFEGIWLEHEADPPSFLQKSVRGAKDAAKGGETDALKSDNDAVKNKYDAAKNKYDAAKSDNDSECSDTASDVAVRGHLDEQVLAEIKRLQTEPSGEPLPLHGAHDAHNAHNAHDFPFTPLTPPMTPRTTETKPTADDDVLSDLDNDEEIHSVLLNPTEIDAKTVIWNEVNRDFLDAQAEIERLEQEAGTLDSTNTLHPATRKARRKRAKTTSSAVKPLPGGEPLAETAAEAAKQALASKKLSKKINYEALESLMTNNKQ